MDKKKKKTKTMNAKCTYEKKSRKQKIDYVKVFLECEAEKINHEACVIDSSVNNT